MGFVHIYSGEGKGKTTAAFGLALRALGRGKRVFIGQFLKHEASGETLALRAFGNADCVLFGVPRRVGDPMRPEDAAAAAGGLARAREALSSDEYDLVVLDEFNVALEKGLIGIDEAIGLLRTRGPRAELVLTGRGAPEALRAEADLVTIMEAAGHYARTGVPAREGIEF